MFIHAAQHLEAAGAPANPCDPDPEMLLTVTGASGTIGWCGQTWNLPGDSGVQKSVCPTSYSKSSFGTFPTNFVHTWRHQVSVNDGLQLRRQVNQIGGSTVSARQVVAWADQSVGTIPYGSNYRDYQYRLGSTGPPTFTDFDLGVMPTTAVLGTAPSDYTILDSQFGSYVFSGITYAWAKGNGWPF